MATQVAFQWNLQVEGRKSRRSKIMAGKIPKIRKGSAIDENIV